MDEPAGYLCQGGVLGFLFLSLQSQVGQTWVNLLDSDSWRSSSPFNHNLSLVNDEHVMALVVVFKSDWSSVTEMEELVGKFKLVSLLPQYFKVAMFTGAVMEAVYVSLIMIIYEKNYQLTNNSIANGFLVFFWGFFRLLGLQSRDANLP